VNAAFPAKLQNGPRGMVDVHQADHQENAMLISDPGELDQDGREPSCVEALPAIRESIGKRNCVFGNVR